MWLRGCIRVWVCGCEYGYEACRRGCYGGLLALMLTHMICYVVENYVELIGLSTNAALVQERS
jgi:hypothetical protein